MAVATAILARSNAVPTSLTNAHTAGTSGGSVLKRVLLVNTTDTDMTATVLVRPAGTGGASDVLVYSNVVVPSQDLGPLNEDEWVVVEANGQIMWQASGAGMHGHLYGLTQ